MLHTVCISFSWQIISAMPAHKAKHLFQHRSTNCGTTKDGEWHYSSLHLAEKPIWHKAQFLSSNPPAIFYFALTCNLLQLRCKKTNVHFRIKYYKSTCLWSLMHMCCLSCFSYNQILWLISYTYQQVVSRLCYFWQSVTIVIVFCECGQSYYRFPCLCELLQ